MQSQARSYFSTNEGVVIAERCVVLVETHMDVPHNEMVSVWKE